MDDVEDNPDEDDYNDCVDCIRTALRLDPVVEYSPRVTVTSGFIFNHYR